MLKQDRVWRSTFLTFDPSVKALIKRVLYLSMCAKGRWEVFLH